MITYRKYVVEHDVQNVRKIVESSGFFSKPETDIAVNMIRERLLDGSSSGYYFLFADQENRTIAYSCFGPIPCTEASYDLYWIAVHDTLRGKGIGEALLRMSEEIIAGQGGQRIYIETSSAPNMCRHVSSIVPVATRKRPHYLIFMLPVTTKLFTSK